MSHLTFKLRFYVIVMMLVLIAGYLVTAFKIVQFGAQESLSSGDAAIVLGAAAWGNKPSPVYRERINQAVLLYKLGRVHWIIFTGGTRQAGYPSEAEVGLQFAQMSGVPPAAMLVDENSHTTWQNLEHAKALMHSVGLHSGLLVSDPLHMKRSMAMAAELGIQVESAPTLSSRFQSLPNWSKFLWRETWLYIGYLIFGHRYEKAIAIDLPSFFAQISADTSPF
jgi:uncharacterized SAM-binding protein YcdF (DUF218 family)